MTREAVALYLTKLKPGGTLIFHLSNKYLDLQPVVAAVGRSLGLRPFFRYQQVTREEYATRAEASMWMVMVRETRATIAQHFPTCGNMIWMMTE